MPTGSDAISEHKLNMAEMLVTSGISNTQLFLESMCEIAGESEYIPVCYFQASF
jgi:hypothetical protein